MARSPMSEAPGRSHGRLKAVASRRPSDLMRDDPPLQGSWEARIITLLPELFPGPLAASLTGRALQQGLWRCETVDLRAFGEGRHRNIDDTPAGGGAGMVLRADIVAKAIRQAERDRDAERADWPLVYLSPRGKPFDQATARRWASGRGVTLLCGRFEGVDQRVLDAFEIEEISLGDFVLTGGEIAAHAMLDATVRLLPGVLGNSESLVEESFSDNMLEAPHYTRPAVWQDRPIPAILTSGDHGAIRDWRRRMSEALTRERRPDLWAARKGSPDEPSA